MVSPKAVCIIGAGPSGIVAAKSLVHDHAKGTFHVTVFEALDRIGGLWPVSEDDKGMVNPQMCTNQSRHTVSFSGLAWPETMPAFPKAWQVGRWLERYVEKYPGYEIKKNTKVVKTSLKDKKWTVRTRSGGRGEPIQERSHEFDYLIISTGFFGKPRVPKILENLPAPVFHSSQVPQSLDDILTNNGNISPRPGRKIVVVGGQMSGVEIAGSIALKLSSGENSPGESFRSTAAEYTIINVVQNPLWIMPLFLPKEPVVDVAGSGKAVEKASNSSSPFLPCDLVTYNLGRRPPGTVQNTSGHISEEIAALTHLFLSTYIGGDQSEYSNHLTMQGDVRNKPPFLAVSDGYTEFVRSGIIQTRRGKLLGGGSGSENALLMKDGEEEYQIEDVAAVVLATGYDATHSLDFLPDEVLQMLQFDPNSDAFPVALNVNSSINKSIPSLGFVGFYRSPYWGVMEMQARYLSALWTGNSKAVEALANDTTLDFMIKLRTDPRRAQFPMGDYAYLMESFGEILSVRRAEPPDSKEERTGLVLPPRYLLPTSSEVERKEAGLARSIIDETISESVTRGKYVARAAFRAMQGDWKLERTITSRIASYPSGTLSGNAYFKPRIPTEKDFDFEYLYLENGEFKADNGFNFTAKRSYAHRYNESTDTLSVWFTKSDQKTVDYFFHSLQFVPSDRKAAKTGKEPWKANSSHLCIEDLYDVEYEFYFQGAGLREWSMEYTVRGPAKDYTIRSLYRR
ncbi:flavin-containing monooxygenase-like protein [Amylocarpus encephaloides]|uniref:Flavin-containing monooxygenase-like protein n=1 Tax=Amylocarpus encephaloides TaxID=45428 RepID=A0A9P7YLZ0_9HELO|nr:flavin-containing monooxygenase-like protein [Amylocarpus encephaloides]